MCNPLAISGAHHLCEASGTVSSGGEKQAMYIILKQIPQDAVLNSESKHCSRASTRTQTGVGPLVLILQAVQRLFAGSGDLQQSNLRKVLQIGLASHHFFIVLTFQNCYSKNMGQNKRHNKLQVGPLQQVFPNWGYMQCRRGYAK